MSGFPIVAWFGSTSCPVDRLTGTKWPASPLNMKDMIRTPILAKASSDTG